jgi:hypothetical protein
MTDAPLRQVPDRQRVTLGRTVDSDGVISEYNSIEVWAGDWLVNERYVLMCDRRDRSDDDPASDPGDVYQVLFSERGEVDQLRRLDEAKRADVFARLAGPKF